MRSAAGGVRDGVGEMARIRRIVVGVDGSEQAAKALRWTIKLAQERDADVTPVFALAPSFPPGGVRSGCKLPLYPCELDPNFRRQLRREFEEDWCAPLRQSGLRYRTVFEDGKAATVIADVAMCEDADLVVIGNRARGQLADPIAGSVGYDLLEHCPKPVVLVGADARWPSNYIPRRPAA